MYIRIYIIYMQGAGLQAWYNICHMSCHILEYAQKGCRLGMTYDICHILRIFFDMRSFSCKARVLDVWHVVCSENRSRASSTASSKQTM